MALQISFQDAFGVNHPQAYCRATVTKILKEGEDFHVEYSIRIYADSTTTSFNDFGNFNGEMVYNLEGTNLIQQIYIHAKANIPELSEAQDV